MNFKKIILLLFTFVFLYNCKNTNVNNEYKQIKSEVKVGICDCLDSLDKHKLICDSIYGEQNISYRQKFECTGDSIYLDTVSKEVKDSIRAVYEEDLSLEIKEIEEEKKDPISEECKKLLEEYAEAIKQFKQLLNKIDKNPDDIALKISYKKESEYMNSWSSNPRMFKCSSSESFKKQIEILNIKKDKLIEN